jgi:hypothetical protein
MFEINVFYENPVYTDSHTPLYHEYLYERNKNKELFSDIVLAKGNKCISLDSLHPILT